MTRFPTTMRVYCRVCGAESRVPAFVRGRSWPYCCGAACLSPNARDVRTGDALTAMARGLAGFAEVR